jgi:exopolysaccharide biosynthesis polyprenyl glycosylphosphotransferase
MKPILKVASPLMEGNGLVADNLTSPEKLYRKREEKPHRAAPPPEYRNSASETKGFSRESLETIVSLTGIVGDLVMIVLGFILADVTCHSSWIPVRIESPLGPSVPAGFSMILAASVIVLWSLAGRELYSFRHLLAPSKISHKLLGALAFCFFVFVGISMVVRTDPPINWKFLVCAAFIIVMAVYNWRLLLSRILRHPAMSSRLRRRLVVIGGGAKTMRIKSELRENSDMEFVGWVEAIKPNLIEDLKKHRLGPLHELESILRENAIDIAVLTETESLQREGVSFVAKTCENEHVQFRMVPHFFEVLVSALRPANIGGIQLLGVECLPLNGHRNQLVKRTVDIVGALVGLVISIPLMIIFGTWVYRESPGPIFYKQIRQGRNGRLFYIIKLRTMRMDAEAHGKAQWAQKDDHRRLRIGAFMRKWNIDEVPQFWNVLKGEMSLVGPRPERPELIARFKSTVQHYQARHMYRPGMTGWAQVNGWRGNTDLDERIRHDIWYLENWNIWLDFVVMAQTFFRRENAY